MHTPLQVCTQTVRANFCQVKMARCRVVCIPVGTPLQVYLQAIRAYRQDILPKHPPLQVDAGIARAYLVPQNENCQEQLQLNLNFEFL